MEYTSSWFTEPTIAHLDALNADLQMLGARSVRSMARQAEINALLQQQNTELRLRLGVLIRLLVQQGTITAEQFSCAVSEAKASVASAPTPALPKPTPKPGAPKPAILPKPPKSLKSRTPPTP